MIYRNDIVNKNSGRNQTCTYWDLTIPKFFYQIDLLQKLLCFHNLWCPILFLCTQQKRCDVIRNFFGHAYDIHIHNFLRSPMFVVDCGILSNELCLFYPLSLCEGIRKHTTRWIESFSTPNYGILVFSLFQRFLAHLSRRLCPLSVVVVVVVVGVVVNFSNFHFFSRATRPISTKLGTKYPWVKGIHVCTNEGLCPLQRGDNYEIAKIYWRN